MTNTRHFDVVIVGGGAAGSAAALTLLAQGQENVAIVEKSDFSRPRIGETIPPDANFLLEMLGVTDVFRAQGHIPCYGSTSVWAHPTPGYNDFLVNVHGQGWHLDRSRFDAMLLNQAEARGAVVFHGAQCLGIKADKAADKVNSVRLRAAAGAMIELTASEFVDATGRSASLAVKMGARKQVDDRQVVISARFRVPARNGFGNSTWLESEPRGWWYGARLPGDQAIVAIGTDPHLAKAAGLYDLRSWLFELTNTSLIAPLLQGAGLIAESFLISSSHSYCLNFATGANWIAVGDSASAFDPLSSAGIYKALQTGRLAADCIAEARPEGRSAYQKRVHDDYGAYLVRNDALYLKERRWPGHGFWKARHDRAVERGHGMVSQGSGR
jgi:flavin-dependent dehydrogenase